MKEKIHDLKTALNVLRIQQTVSFDDCQNLMTDVHDKTGFTPPNFEISGNQWCVLVNLAVARFGNTTPPQREWVGLTDAEIAELHHEIKVRLMGTYKTEDIYRAIEAKLREKNGE